MGGHQNTHRTPTILRECDTCAILSADSQNARIPSRIGRAPTLLRECGVCVRVRASLTAGLTLIRPTHRTPTFFRERDARAFLPAGLDVDLQHLCHLAFVGAAVDLHALSAALRKTGCRALTCITC